MKGTVAGGLTWGDMVRVVEQAPTHYHPGGVGSLCGFFEIESVDVAKARGLRMGDVLCLVEFGDGTTVEIPRQLLVKVE